MSKYQLKVGKNAKDFKHQGQTYKSGSTYDTDDPCDALGFFSSYSGTNTEGGRKNATPDFWQNMEKACAANAGAGPGNAPAGGADEGPPAGESDSAAKQGAPAAPENIDGGDTEAPGPGTGDDAPGAEEEKGPADGDPHGTRSGEQTAAPTTGGDPVDLFSGTVYLDETDLFIPNTILPLALVRAYRSGAGFYCPLGWNWDHNHNLFIRELTNGDLALWRMAHEERFVFTGAEFEPPRGVFEKLERIGGIGQAYDLAGPGGMVSHFERPAGWTDATRVPIQFVRDRHGNRLSYTYDARDNLVRVADDDSRFIGFDYDQCNLVVAAFDHAGRRYLYEHDEEAQHLAFVTKPATADFPDGVTRRYDYPVGAVPPSVRHNLLGITDSEGNTYLENSYEEDPASLNYGRVVAQRYGDYLYQFCYEELQFVVAADVNVNVPASRTEVLNPEFGLETYTFNFRGDLLDRRYRLNRDGSYRICAYQYDYDGQANLTRTVRPDGSEERYVFDDGHADPRMRGTRLRRELIAASGFPVPSRIVERIDYEPRYQLPTRQVDERGATTRMRYDFDLNPGSPANSGKLMEMLQPDATLPDGTIQSATTRFEYDARGQISATILADGTRNEMHYGAAGAEQGRLIEEVYDAAGLAISNRRRYDAVGFVTQNIDGNGAVTERSFDALGQLERLVRPAIAGVTAEERYRYNSDGHVVRIERPKGAYALPLSDPAATHFIDLFERDVLGYATRVTLSSNCADSRVIRYRNDYRGVAVKATMPDGAVIHTTVDERQLPVEERVVGSDGLEIRSRSGHDRAGKLVRQTDVQGRVTQYEHDGFGRVRTITLPNGTQRHQTWLPLDLLGSEEVVGDDGTGVVRRLSFVQHAYDEKRRRVSSIVQMFEDDPTVSSNDTSVFFYDTLDRLVRAEGERGATLIRRYDGLGRLIEQTDPMGNVERIVYDAVGNIVEHHSDHVVPGGGIATISKRYEYDARGRRTATIEPDGARTSTVFDDRDVAIRTTDRLGAITTTDYDSFNMSVSQVHDVGGLAIGQQWHYDAMSRVVAYIDAMGETSHYGYDTVGRKTSIAYPGGFSSTRIYNDAGQVVKERLASGVELDFAYDAANRLTGLTSAAAPAPVQAVADHQFAYDGLDRVVSAVAGTNVARSYDSRGRLLSESNHGSALSCRYDDAAGTVEKRWPTGRTEMLAHDLNGHLASITQTASGGLGAGNGVLAEFVTSGPGALGEARLRGGAVLANSFDERKRLTGIALSSPAGLNEQVQYRYDPGDRRRIEAIAGAVPKTSYFEFDRRRRLVLARDRFAAAIPAAATQAQHDGAIAAVAAASAAAAHAETFAYDPADARTAKTETGVPANAYNYGPGHRLLGDGVNAFAHGPDGPFTSGGTFTYESDALGRIVAVRSGAALVLELDYDAFGRVSAIRPAGEPERRFHYLGAFIEQESVGGVPERQITVTPGTGVPIAYHRAGTTHFALVDARYNLLGLIGTDGRLVEAYRYKSFGAPEIFDALGAQRANSAFGVRPVFGGQSYLAGPGLYLATKRVMEPKLGQFLSPDPLGYPDSPMLYGYAAQNPIDLIDPSGEIIPFIVAAFVIGGALAGAGYSAYDAYHHPEKYEGGSGTLRIFGNVFGGALIGGVAILGGEAILAAGGTGIFASGAAAGGGGLASLTAAQTFFLYGTSSAVSGGILRYGFNGLFPEYVNQISAGTVAFDFVAGGAFATAARAIEPAFNAAKSGLSSWFRYGLDQGGEAAQGVALGPYPGKIGQSLDKIGIRQGYSSVIQNLDAGGSWFARTDTAVHEGFHALVQRYLPTFRELSYTNRFWGAAARYPEEVAAYALGHAGALRPHGIPFAPLEAFNSLSAYSPGQQLFAKLFWGTFWAGLSAYAIDKASSSSSSDAGNQAQPNRKPAGAK